MNSILDSIMNDLEKELEQKHKKFEHIRTLSYPGGNGKSYVFCLRLKNKNLFGITIDVVGNSITLSCPGRMMVDVEQEGVQWFFKKYGKEILVVYQDILKNFESLAHHPQIRLYAITHEIVFVNEMRNSGLEGLLELHKKKPFNFLNWIQTFRNIKRSENDLWKKRC